MTLVIINLAFIVIPIFAEDYSYYWGYYRFSHPHRQSQVSRWIQPHIKVLFFSGIVFLDYIFFILTGFQSCSVSQDLEKSFSL